MNNSNSNFDLIKEEYTNLRQEIEKNNESCMKIINSAFTITGATISFLLTQGNVHPFVFLLPFIILTPSIFLIISRITSIKRIAAYLSVFIESNSNIKWETRLVNLDKLKLKGRDFHAKSGIIIMYFVSGIVCLFLYYSALGFKNLTLLHFIISFPPILFHFYAIPQYYNTDNIWNKNKFLKVWKSLKDNEESQSINYKTVANKSIAANGADEAQHQQ